jgi:4-aminobutyrate aminotransferase-like enzyme
VQDAINPIAVERAEGRYFYDYDGKRYLDFASQLVNVSIGHSHPKIVQAIKDQAERSATIGPPMATESRSRLGKLLAEVTPGDLSMSSSRTAAPRRTRTRSSSPAGTRAATRSSRATAATTGRRPARSR